MAKPLKRSKKVERARIEREAANKDGRSPRNSPATHFRRFDISLSTPSSTNSETSECSSAQHAETHPGKGDELRPLKNRGQISRNGGERNKFGTKFGTKYAEIDAALTTTPMT